MKVIQWMCVTLNSKVNRQGHEFVFNIFDILDLENVRIDTKINFVSCLQPEIWKVMQKGVWPWFSRSCNKDRIFSLSPLDSLTPKTYPWEIFLKNSDGKTKIQGGGTHPPLGVRRWIFTLGICGLNYINKLSVSRLRDDCRANAPCFESFQNREFKWHAGCYTTITHRGNYEKLEKRFSEAKLSEHDRSSTSHLERHTRAKNSEYKKETCFFCDQASCKRNILRKIVTDNAGANLKML